MFYVFVCYGVENCKSFWVQSFKVRSYKFTIYLKNIYGVYFMQHKLPHQK